MNVPQMCEHVYEVCVNWVPGPSDPCKNLAEWVVFDKTDCKHLPICNRCLRSATFSFIPGHTYVISPAKDYSKHASGHDLPADNSKSGQEE